MKRLYALFVYYRFILRDFFYDHIAKHLPVVYIPPEVPNFGKCQQCLDEIDDMEGELDYITINPTLKKYAVDTGDGWALFWDCDQQHNDNGQYDIEKFPFLFGWCSVNDLQKHGFEVS